MRAAVISDPHRNLRSRREEARHVLDSLVPEIRRQRVDLVLIPGDIYEENPTLEDEDDCARWLVALADEAPLVAIPGNHDLGITLPPRLRLPCSEAHAPRHPLLFVDSPRVVYAAGAAIACLPWPHTGQLLAMMGDAGREERHHAGIAGLRAILLGLRAELGRHDGPRILIAHAQVRGARLGKHVPARTDFNLGIEDLASVGADFVGLAHLHEHQHWTFRVDDREVAILYAGSPFANTWGEVEKKGYVIVDFDDARPASGSPLRGWEFVPTIATPLAHVETAFVGGRFETDGAWLNEDTAPAVKGHAVRFRFDVPSDQREAAGRLAEQAAARLRELGATDVVIEPIVQPVVRARMPEITAAEKPSDKVALWATGQGEEPERVERLRGMTASLEKEASQ